MTNLLDFVSRNLTWPTFSPRRIRFYTQEIVVFREDMVSKMQRHCIVPPSDEETDEAHKHVCLSAGIRMSRQMYRCVAPWMHARMHSIRLQMDRTLGMVVFATFAHAICKNHLRLRDI